MSAGGAPTLLHNSSMEKTHRMLACHISSAKPLSTPCTFQLSDVELQLEQFQARSQIQVQPLSLPLEA